MKLILGSCGHYSFCYSEIWINHHTMKCLDSSFIRRDLGVRVGCKLDMNHHLGVAQKETPYWDYKQNSDLQDTERNLWAQLSSHKSSVNLSPLLGNTLGETRMNLREPRSEKKKMIRGWEAQLTRKKKNQMENSICSPSCGEQGNKPRDYTATNKVLLREQREPAERGTIEGWNGFICEPSCCKEHSRHWNNTAELDFVVLSSAAVCWNVLAWWNLHTIYAFQTSNYT